MKVFGSEKALSFTESVIRDMTRVCLAHQGINLAQGFPDFSGPDEIKEAAVR
ncbi:MAG TPA: aminotransferase, partial [Thermodesulfobacteriota bacterium]|nr:aminotransferase [Thermodesulfobacteriota bacterium]